MGAFWIPRIELITTASEIVGYKAGIALTREDMARLLGDDSYIVGDDKQALRVRSEEFEELIAELLYAVGNIPSPSIGSPIIDVYHRHKHNEEELQIYMAVSKGLPAFLKSSMEDAKGKRQSIDPTAFLEGAQREHGPLGAQIALELLRGINSQMHRSPWGTYRREEWADTQELKALFESESLDTNYGTFFDQRFVDYLAQQFDDIDRIHWRQFEGLTCEFFDRAGFRVEIGAGRGDGNVDARVWSKEQNPQMPPVMLVQCKRQKSKVGNVVVKALYADVLHENASSGLVVTTTGLSPGAKKVCTARSYPISGIDRGGLVKWINLMKTPGTGVFMGE